VVLWRQDPDATGCNWNARIDRIRGSSSSGSSWWGGCAANARAPQPALGQPRVYGRVWGACFVRTTIRGSF
jgi:hypothetical protein